MIKKIINSLKTKNARVLIENFVSLSLLNVLGYIFPILTLPYLAKTIGVSRFGDIAFATAVMIYFQTVVDWGFNFTATRDIAKYRDDIKQVSIIFSRVLWSKLVLVFLSFIFLVLLVLYVPTFIQNKQILLVSFLMVIGNAVFPQWLFQGLEKMRFITIINLLSRLLFTLGVFVFIKDEEDYIYQPLLVSMGQLVGGVISIFVVLKWKIKILKPNVKSIFVAIKSSSDIFLNQLMPNLYNSFSILLLGYWGGSAVTGIYDAGNKFTSLGQTFSTIVSRVFFPYLARDISNHYLYAKLTMILSVALSSLLFVFAPFIIKLFFPEEFYEASIVMRILSFSLVFLTLTDVYGTNYLILQKKEKLLRNITFVVSILGFVLALILVYNFNYIGTALTVTLTRAILGLSVLYFSKQFNPE